MLKQRKDSLEIYRTQNRADLAKKEEEEIAIIEKFLPAQMSEAELKETLQKNYRRGWSFVTGGYGKGDGCSYKATGRQS